MDKRILISLVALFLFTGCASMSHFGQSMYSYKLKKPDSPVFEGTVYAKDPTDAGLIIFNATGYLPYEIKEVD